MREIKFRGKRLDNGEWIYGDLITDGVDFQIHCKDQRCRFNKDDCKQTLLKSYKVNPKTVGQYTGLKDKNGKEIYEEDIVTRKGFYPFFDVDSDRYNYLAIIEWVFCGFQYVLKCVNPEKRGISDGINEPIEDAENFEVIGNIYENQKLLENKNERD